LLAGGLTDWAASRSGGWLGRLEAWLPGWLGGQRDDPVRLASMLAGRSLGWLTGGPGSLVGQRWLAGQPAGET
jgi:hypothetical protein